MTEIPQELMTPHEAARWFRRSPSWLRQQARLLRVSYKTVSALVQAYSADISEGGLYVPARNFLPVGTIVELDAEGKPLMSFVKLLEDGRLTW